MSSFHMSAFCRGKERHKQQQQQQKVIYLFSGACNIRSAAYHCVFVSALSSFLRKFKLNVAKRPYRP